MDVKDVMREVFKKLVLNRRKELMSHKILKGHPYEGVSESYFDRAYQNPGISTIEELLTVGGISIEEYASEVLRTLNEKTGVISAKSDPAKMNAAEFYSNIVAPAATRLNTAEFQLKKLKEDVLVLEKTVFDTKVQVIESLKFAHKIVKSSEKNSTKLEEEVLKKA